MILVLNNNKILQKRITSPTKSILLHKPAHAIQKQKPDRRNQKTKPSLIEEEMSS